MTKTEWKLEIGANPIGNGNWKFRVWAPFVNEMRLALTDGEKEAQQEMEREPSGYFSTVQRAAEDSRYAFILDKKKRRPDPASRYQPDGINEDSSLVNPENYAWQDGSWKGIDITDLIIYELHVGTFTSEGTFESLIPKLGYLAKELGITAIEIMPVAQFPGSRNWGYDGVLMYSVQNSYGGPAGLKKLVNACHASKLAVFLDVVYNHLGPEGNYLADFGPYFSSRYLTPWGPAINYDDRGSDEVRKYVVNNAIYWLTEYHIDGLRLDAVHGIFDSSPKHLLQEINEAVKVQTAFFGRKVHLIAESDLNDPKIISPEENCGYGLDAQWSDDFHHSIHAYFTGEKYGYYADYGDISDIEKALRDVFVYDGRYSKFRDRLHGANAAGIPRSKFVVCIQNHDQIGNRPDGSRLASLVGLAVLKVAAGMLLLSPFIPMIFMGEECGERAPFYFFTSHTDPAIASATREGRKKEFKLHKFEKDFADPQDEKTLEKSKINLDLRFQPANKELFGYYKELIGLRKSHPAFKDFDPSHIDVRMISETKAIFVTRRIPAGEELVSVFTLNKEPIELRGLVPKGQFVRIFSSEPSQIDANGAFFSPPMSVSVFKKYV